MKSCKTHISIFHTVFTVLFIFQFVFANFETLHASENSKKNFLLEQQSEDVDGEEIPEFEMEEEIFSESTIGHKPFFETEQLSLEDIEIFEIKSMNYLPFTPPPEKWV